LARQPFKGHPPHKSIMDRNQNSTHMRSISRRSGLHTAAHLLQHLG